jgi:hypothetical protein
MSELCLCRDTDTITYHIYKCKQNISSCRFTSNIKSECGHIDKPINPYCLKVCKDINTMRLEIAKYANNDKQICGQCVSTIYKNKIK